MPRLLISSLAFTLFVACAPAGVDMPFDSDGDGLMDLDEEGVGTDPFVADSDGDGHLDGLEFDQGADPLNAEDHPYKGGYGGIDRSCKSSLSATGNEEGAVTDNFSLLDQHGEDVKLWDFCGRAVLLVAGAFWCGSCQAEVPHMQELYETYADRGLMVIGLYSETEESGVMPTAEDLQRWSDTYGTTFPVVADDASVWTRFEKDYGIPSLTLLSPGAVVVSADGGSVDGLLEDVLPE